jgi:hypothetical protein
MKKLKKDSFAGTKVDSEQVFKIRRSASLLPNPMLADVHEKHYLEYSMYSCKVSWCPICNHHFYNERNESHTTKATNEHYHIPLNKVETQPPTLFVLELLERIKDYMDDRSDILEVGDSYGEQRPNIEMSFYVEIESAIEKLSKHIS